MSESRISAAAPLLSRDAAEKLAKRVLSFSTADEARVSIQGGWSGNTRFAGNEITTAGGTVDTTVRITSTFGKRSATAETNVLDDAGLKRTVELSERLAKLSPEDPENLPELGPQQYTTVNAYRQATADLTPEARAVAVKNAFDGAHSVGSADPNLFVGGFLEAQSGLALAVANNKGLFAYHPATSVNMSVTVRTSDGTGSGYASAGGADWAGIDAAALGRRAAQKAMASRNPVAIEPGQYTVILEPQAVSDVLPLLMGSFNARSADEGRSPFSKAGGATKIGEKIADERVTLYADPTDADLLEQPFDAQGQPVGRTVFIDKGVLKNLSYTRFWAERKKVAPSGNGGGLKMVGTSKSVEDLIASTQRGILVTRFYYIRFLDQRTVMVTGLTRDGTFLIENGKISRAIKNLRWNESPLFMLNKLEDIGRAERVTSGLVVPALKVKDWNFTSLSDAV